MLSQAQKNRLIQIAIKNGVAKDVAEKMDDTALQAEGMKFIDKLPETGELEKHPDVKALIDPLNTQLTTKTTELESAQSRETELKQKLSKEDDDAPTPRELKMARTSAIERIDAAVVSKKFSPIVGDFIKARIKEEPMGLVLARGDEDEKPELYETMMEIATLASSATPPGGKEQQKEKKLSRETSVEGDDTPSDPTEQERMAASAKKAGEALEKRRSAPVLSGVSRTTGQD